jgi:uncharacterized protein (TIGR00725 family)
VSQRAVMIAVIGAGSCSDEISGLAEQVGAQVARRGAMLVCGGLGGVMAAACRGARLAGGTTIGLLPGTSPASANDDVAVPIATGLGEARNVIVVGCAQAVIAIAGEYGTLSEIGHALKMGKPVVGLRTWQISRHGQIDWGIHNASTPEQAVELALSLAGAPTAPAREG